MTGLRLFGCPPGDIEAIFGHPNRTMAVLIVATLGIADPSTIARVVGVQPDGDMHRLLDPLEADGLVTSGMAGSIRLYGLAKAPWLPAVLDVCRSVLTCRPDMASRIAPARTLMAHGKHSGRTNLRRRLGLEPPVPQRRRRGD